MLASTSSVFAGSEKFAVTAVALLIVTMHVVPWPEHAPDQPTNVWPMAGTAVSVMLDVLVYCAAHVMPQLIPPSADDTVPAPVPVRVTVSEPDTPGLAR